MQGKKNGISEGNKQKRQHSKDKDLQSKEKTQSYTHKMGGQVSKKTGPCSEIEEPNLVVWDLKPGTYQADRKMGGCPFWLEYRSWKEGSIQDRWTQR